ncbi:F1F0 ATP synthase subunit e, mitochondrial [Cryomyces antarcticus]|nr:F1F0 ATP synthase subunit e, mitochondrial [Cryomyces antarcticus]
MASSGANVFRYSALALGIFYGFYHQSTITASEKLQGITREYERKSKLIDEAKAAYTKKNMPQSAKTAGGDRKLCTGDQQEPERVVADTELFAVITDPMDPKFDLEAYLNLKQAGEK